MADFDLNEILNDDEAPEEGEGESPVVEFIERMLQDAAKKDASSVYFTPVGEAPLAFRIRGKLVPQPMDVDVPLDKVVVRLKILAALDITERRRPQTGWFDFGEGWGVLASILPTASGETVALKLHPPRETPVTFESLGVPAETIDAVRSSRGIVVVAGAAHDTAMGLEAVCSELTGKRVAFISRSGRMGPPHVLRVTADANVGGDMALMVREALRQDFDAIVLPDIDGPETGSLLFREAEAHCVTGMRGRNAARVPARLLDLGIPVYHIQDRLGGVLGIRMARRLCPSCRRRRPPNAGELGVLPEELTTVSEAGGCDTCAGSGHADEIALTEWMPVTDAVRAAMEKGADAVQEAAFPSGRGSMRESALALVKDGAISVREYVRLVGESAPLPGL